MRPTLTVTELLSRVKAAISTPELTSSLVKGELTNFRYSPSDHLYFVIQDRRCQIRCVMFAADARRLRFRPHDGLTVIVSGQLTLYGPKGDLQFQVKAMRPDGKGQLYEQLARLKHRLHAEGLFDSSRRRSLPVFPRTVGVVTSLQGAVLRDIATTLRRRNPSIRLVVAPASVQGDLAPRELARALRRLAPLVEVVIIARGGGSFEDLLAFNSEQVVRAVAACPVPIVSAVGHETDVTMCDLAADKRAPTPTAAAEIVAPPRAKMLEEVEGLRGRLSLALDSRSRNHRQFLDRLLQSPALLYPFRTIEQEMQRIDDLKTRLPLALARRVKDERGRLEALRRSPALRFPEQLVAKARERLAELTAALPVAMERRLTGSRLELAGLGGELKALSPLGVLERGYAICLDQDGKPIQAVAGRTPQEKIEVRLADGSLAARIESVRPKEIPR
ncbi:MAG: exodeoxyribonuclease VII large subunit [Vulcanimicrobiota bacterium]